MKRTAYQYYGTRSFWIPVQPLTIQPGSLTGPISFGRELGQRAGGNRHAKMVGKDDQSVAESAQTCKDRGFVQVPIEKDEEQQKKIGERHQQGGKGGKKRQCAL